MNEAYEVRIQTIDKQCVGEHDKLYRMYWHVENIAALIKGIVCKLNGSKWH